MGVTARDQRLALTQALKPRGFGIATGLKRSSGL